MELSDIRVQKVGLLQQKAPLADVEGKLRQELKKLDNQLGPGMRVAITVGSRGIANIDRMAKTVADYVAEKGGVPFFVPAMGSHGGATAEGQAAVLAGYGVSERALGYPVLSSMRVHKLGSTGGEPDIPVYMDLNAWEADGVIAMNRVKAHTDFHGTHEGGIVKILAIGLGKKAQAVQIHRFGAQGLREDIARVSEKVLESGKILGAVAILEDGYDETSDVIMALPEEVFEVDAMLLERSRSIMAKLPFEQIDLLVVDCMGKNYSGTGIDTNVIGRMRIGGQQDTRPFCGKIVTLDLSDESEGNALGIGLSDVVPRRLYDKVDWKNTMENVITSGFFERGFTPVIREDDREAINTALQSIGGSVEHLRFARIRNTLELNEIYLSPALLKALPENLRCGEPGPPQPLEFGADGSLNAF